MRVTQGTFSYLPDLTDEQIRRQLDYAVGKGWAVSIEVTDDAHPRNVYWEMWEAPMFDLGDAGRVVQELEACRQANPGAYVKVNAFDASSGWETVRLSFIVQRPAEEPDFSLLREEGAGRRQRYAVRGRASGLAPGRAP